MAYASFSIAEIATWLAMLVYAYAQGGVTETGVLATVLLLVSAAAAPTVAASGDRFAPGKVLLAGYVCQAGSCAAVAVAMLAHTRPELVYVLLAVPAVAYTATRPTQAAFVPALARRPDELAAANIALGWIESASMFVAPLGVGVCLAVSSPGVLFAAGAALCAGGAILVWPLRTSVPALDEGERGEAGFAASLSFLGREPNARTLVLLLGVQSAALGALDILYVELARGVLHRGGDWAGYLNAAFGAGSVLAVGVTARLLGRPRLALPLIVSLAGWTVALFGLSAVPGVVGALALLGLAGGARATFDVTGRTLLQRIARPDLVARVFGVLEGLEMLGLAFGSLLAPLLISVGGTSAAFVGVGLLLPIVVLITGRRLLDIDRHATVPVVQVALLRSLPMFALLPPPTLESLARALVPADVGPGIDVITQGEEGDRFYVIADGEVDVIADGRRVATVGRGAAFGEIALLYEVPRTATVRTRRATYLYELESDAFLAVLTGHPASHTVLRRLADERIEDLRRLREEKHSAAAQASL